ncbi:MAG: DUF6471 domain-containing protein [Pseudomonadota bacterium]
MFDSPPMRETIRRLIRSRMAFKGMEYKDLCRALAQLGVHQNESNLRSKVNNGSLGAQLFVYILMAMDTSALDMAQVDEILQELAPLDAPDVAENQAVGSTQPDTTQMGTTQMGTTQMGTTQKGAGHGS